MKCLCAQLPWASTKIPLWLLYCLSLIAHAVSEIFQYKKSYIQVFLKITEYLLRDTVGQDRLFWMVQKDNKKEQSQCTPGLRKIIRPELSDFCKMLVDIEASTRDIFNVRTCGRKDKGVRAGIYYFSVFCTSVNASFISIPDICHFWSATSSGGVD